MASLYFTRIGAIRYLETLGNQKVSDIYDTDKHLSGVLIQLIPNFEYPDWSHKTCGEIASKLSRWV